MSVVFIVATPFWPLRAENAPNSVRVHSPTWPPALGRSPLGCDDDRSFGRSRSHSIVSFVTMRSNRDRSFTTQTVQ
ncbi:hypothetical protein [Phormidium sp. CCY1219]|uniref:hypothetical protein n=1 Tax=Phormidium sp. CCY1219 TaxID=2886104 RepID=UPI002D1F8A16|nr:hypothetical protein [Phormidium sp. CCY1219]MEB3830851.1 hypothetical protein [Phormidium sp. CCY1219]